MEDEEVKINKLDKALKILQKYKEERPVQIREGLYLSSFAAGKNPKLLDELNISHILSLTDIAKNDGDQDSKYIRLHLSMIDSTKQDLVPVLRIALKFMLDVKKLNDENKNHNGILVHCFQGISRSVAILMAYLMYTEDVGVDDAYQIIKNVRPQISPNPGFIKQLQSLEEDLRKHVFELES